MRVAEHVGMVCFQHQSNLSLSLPVTWAICTAENNTAKVSSTSIDSCLNEQSTPKKKFLVHKTLYVWRFTARQHCKCDASFR